MLTEIRLYGALAAKYGPTRRYAVKSPRSAYKALDVNLGDFFDTIKDMHIRTVVSPTADPDAEGAFDLDLDMLPMHSGGAVIHIIPVPAGAMSGKGNAIGKIIAGILIITAVIVTGGAVAAAFGSGATWSFMGVSSGMWGLMGVNFILGGVAGLLAPAPPGSDPNDQEQDPTTLFNSTANVGAQGQAVPIIYGGPIKVGSVVVSAGLGSEQVKLGSGVNYNATTDNPDFFPADYWTWVPGVGGGDYGVN